MVNNKNTAKNGYKEEELVCNDLNNNNNILKKIENKFNFNNIGIFVKKSGNSKTDINSTNLKAQVKKTKKNQFGQVARHNVDDLLDYIPQLKEHCSTILKNLCEIPLNENNKVDKSKGRKDLSLNNYTQKELDDFINSMNNNIIQIIEYALLGKDINNQPDLLIEIEYENNIRKNMNIFKMSDIIDHIKNEKFNISKRKTVINLGINSIFTIQRKGGDNGNPSSNQIQFKCIFSRLNIKNCLHIPLTNL